MKFTPKGKIAITLIIALAAGGMIFALKKFAPKADKQERGDILPTVEVVKASRSSTPVKIRSQSRVAGQVHSKVALENSTLLTIPFSLRPNLHRTQSPRCYLIPT